MRIEKTKGMMSIKKKKWIKRCLWGAIVLILLVGISFAGVKSLKVVKTKFDSINDEKNSQIQTLIDQQKEQESKVNDSLSSTVLNLKINNEPVTLNMSQNVINAEAPTLSTETKNKITLDVPRDTEVTINGQPYKDGGIELPIESLNNNNKITIVLKSKKDNANRQIIIPTVPKSFPKLEISGQNVPNLKGDYYGNIERPGDSYIYKINPDGQLKYYYHSQVKNGSVANFKKYKINGKVYYTFFKPIDNYKSMNEQGLVHGEIVVMNDQYQVIKELMLNKTNLVKQGAFSENHDYIMLAPNHYVLLAEILVPHKDDDGNVQQLRTPYIQEIKDGKVVFEWIASDYPSLLKSSVESAGKDKNDYMHTNSITIDPKDNNFIISNRNLDSVLKINRKSGKIMWTLGGKNDDFNLSKDQQFARQHYAYLDLKGNILLFNNNNPEKKTNIMQFALDEKNHKVTDFNKYEFGDKFSAFCGDVQQISKDLFFIGWGMSNDSTVASLYNCKTKQTISSIVSDYNKTYRIQYFE